MDIASEKFKNYFNSLGQQSLEYNRHSVCITKDGRILFGGINGITSINPSVVDVTSRRPVVEFTSVQSEIKINPYGHEKASETKILPAGTTFIEFQFQAIDYFKSKELQLQYKLDGIDTKWESVQNPGYARYMNLKPGKYVFKVVEGGKDELQTQKAKTFYFEIAKFWWQTLIFKILMVGLILFMVYFVLQLWIKQKLSAEKHILEKQLVILKEQERISSDLHDDIGSTLSSISIYSELADKYYQTFPEKSQDMIQKISKQSKELMSRIEDIIWSLKPNTEHNISIKKKIQEIALESLALKNILFTLEVDENTDLLVTEPELRKNIVLIIKEAIHNIAKYSEATEAKISIQYDQKNIVLSISDNGIGFDQNNIKKGNGLGNMKKRTSDMNGICSIQTAKGSGVIITCHIPIARFRY
jgi:signal transduction histidine kinase